ncbi:type IV toxin-antitoxin system AbiEi family antitoxin domain-containing protein [Neorhodopirellula lusitana]|uniref:type IV toxin-antitoxin system AbiEi family antitoxin domain-containing protein n=1 Tax=Neorhodopirellula lusitana TaxID=445327 RepID=UPI00384BB26B
MDQTKKDRILSMFRESGVLRPRDLERAGISGVYLNKLHAEGILDRPSRGIYTLVDGEPSENHSIAQACKQIPRGTICLLSALRLHDLTTQSPFEVWLAIGEKSRLPKIDSPPLRIVRFSGDALSYGVVEQEIEGVAIRSYSPAKTVADCFKYRNKIGLDVAIEALRDCLTQRKATMDEIWEAAKVCRMSKVMRPYMESVM